MLLRQAKFSIFTINILRSLERKIGVYEIIRRRQQNQIVLVDEGPVLLAHNVFVYSSAHYTHEEIDRFASLVPLPDIIIYIKAPIDILVQRALLRADPPREIRSRNKVLVEKHINSAVEMFDQLVKAEHIWSRLLTVENSGLKHQDLIINDIVKFITNHKLVGKSI
jgi:thymidylate kinase